MLPPERYELACRLFCRILHRLEERDANNGQQKDSTPNEYRKSNNAIVEGGTNNGIPLSSVPSRQYTRTEEECVRRDATR